MYEMVNNSFITMNLENEEIVYLRGLTFIQGMKVEDALESLYNNLKNKPMFYDVSITPIQGNHGETKLLLQRPKKNKGGRPKKA